MMTEIAKSREKLRQLLYSQPLAVLSTQNKGQPYANLVAFVASDDLKTIYFATSRSTRKFDNLKAVPSAALLIDNRSNRSSDFQEAAAVTALGSVSETIGSERETAYGLYLTKHPTLEEFIKSPDSALMRIQVDTYILADGIDSISVVECNDGLAHRRRL